MLGGFDNRKDGVLYSGTKEEVQKEAVRLVTEAGDIGVIIGADCTLPSDIPVERMKWVREALDSLAK